MSTLTRRAALREFVAHGGPVLPEQLLRAGIVPSLRAGKSALIALERRGELCRRAVTVRRLAVTRPVYDSARDPPRTASSISRQLRSRWHGLLPERTTVWSSKPLVFAKVEHELHLVDAALSCREERPDLRFVFADAGTRNNSAVPDGALVDASGNVAVLCEWASAYRSGRIQQLLSHASTENTPIRLY